MSDESAPLAPSIVESAEISAAANAEAKNKTSIWADKLEIESLIVLNSLMKNFATWNPNFRNELMKRDSMDAIKFHHNASDKLAVVENKNVSIFLKKSVNARLLQMIEEKNVHYIQRIGRHGTKQELYHASLTRGSN